MLEACFIRVEVKKRELVSRTDLAIEMVRRGVPVILGEVYSSDELEKIGVDQGYLFGKCAQPDTLSKFRPLLDLGWTFGALDEEGLLPDTLESFAAQRFSTESAEAFEDVFFFGEAQKNAFKNIFGYQESFIVSGNPRTDMWQANCYDIYDSVIREIKGSYGDFVLLPLNFGYYTNSVLREASTQGDLKSTNQVLAEKSQFLFDSFCKLAERLATDAAINVVVRPHPADDPESVKTLMARHGVRSDRVSCISTNDVFPWISAARLVVHNCCTTSLEAGFCGTPVVTYAPSGTSLYQDSAVNNLFSVAGTPDDILDILASDQSLDAADFRLRVADWGRLSLDHSGHVSTFIADRIMQRHTFTPRLDKLRLNRRLDLKGIKYEIAARLASMMGQSQRRVLLQKFPRTRAQEVKTIVNQICKYRGYHERPKVIALNSRLFGILPGAS